MERMNYFTPAQCEVINTVACLTSDEDVRSLKKVLVQFLNHRLQNELNRLWDSGELNQERINAMGQEHLRTTYK